MTAPFHVREAHPDDEAELWRFLAIAGYELSAEAARSVEVVASHLVGWQRPGDFGVVAERDGLAIGAAWARQFRPEEGPGYYAGPMTPEISIGVLPGSRGIGVGEAMLRRLVELAMLRRCDSLCLTVRDSNPARRLYERIGFGLVEGVVAPNRVGGLSLGMLLVIDE
jgi:ribosomal protein S18 acetylase RimI-like enzyme